MKDLCFCTVASKARLAHVNVLTESLSTHHPKSKVFFLLVDNIENFFDPLSLKKNMELIEASALKNVPNISELFFKYNAFEATTALKPYFCEYLLNTYNMQKLVYLDSDIYVTMKMDALNRLLAEFSIILTPHITKELPLDGYCPDELDFLKAGTFNTGFIGISNAQEALKFLSWWKNRLWHFGLMNPAEGMNMDQRWIDLVPSLFDKVHILKDPGYNVAFWNLHERKLSMANGQILVNGEPLKFFHFSGFNPDNIEAISQYQNRYTLADFSALRYLLSAYKTLLMQNGYKEIHAWPYSHNFFDNGIAIPLRARRIYWSLGNANKRFGNPFETNKKNAFEKYYSRIYHMGYKCLDKLIEVGMRYKKFFNKFPRLKILAKKFYKFLVFGVGTRASNFFVKK